MLSWSLLQLISLSITLDLGGIFVYADLFIQLCHLYRHSKSSNIIFHKNAIKACVCSCELLNILYSCTARTFLDQILPG